MKPDVPHKTFGIANKYLLFGIVGLMFMGLAIGNQSSVTADFFYGDGSNITGIVQPYSYLVYNSSSTYYAKNGVTGSIDFSGTDFVPVLNNSLNSARQNFSNGGTVVLKAGDYYRGTTKTTVYIANGTKLIGENRNSTWVHVVGTGTGALFDLGDNAELSSLSINGDHQSVVQVNITMGDDQKIDNMYMIYPNTAHLINYSTVAVGKRSVITHSLLIPETIGTGSEAIMYPDDGATGTDRELSFNAAGGGYLADINGANNLRVIGNDVLNFTFSSTSAKKIILTGNRIATTGYPLTINGIDHVITSNTVAGNITLASGVTGATVQSNTQTCCVIDNSGSSTNLIDQNQTIYTPVWSGVGAPSIGDGTLTGYYFRNGRTVTATINMVTGAGTTYGTGAWSFSLPYTNNGNAGYVGSGYLLNTGVGFYAVSSYVVPSGTTITLYGTNNTGDGVKATVPFTWAGAGNELHTTITYSI